MPRFAYSGVTFGGQSTSGILRASNTSRLRDRLQDLGILLVDARPARNSWPLKWTWFHRSFEPVISRYFRDLSTLVGAGVSLSRALDGLAERSTGRIWKPISISIASDVRHGTSLEDALSAHSEIFSRLDIALVKAGEQSGRLATVLQQIADHREKSGEFARKVKAALAYPITVAIVAVAVIWIMLTHIVPVFADMFVSLGTELPEATLALLSLSEFAQNIWWILPLLAILVIAGREVLVKNDVLMLRASHFALSLPLFGSLLAKLSVARVSRTAATLLENGIPLVSALETAAQTSSNRSIQVVFVEAANTVEQGRPLSLSLSGARRLPPLAAQVLTTGEESANVRLMFGRLADSYESETESSLRIVSSVLEPLLVVIMGVVVASILIALYLPMFDLLGHIG